MKSVKIGIIGGQGLMGQFFKNMFEQDGIKVHISDLNTKLTNKELIKLSDVVIVAVPINKTLDVINEVSGQLREDQLFMDITSVKGEPVNAMIKSKASVIGMHPMFGPFIESIGNQTIILTPARDNQGWMENIESYFTQKKVKIKITTPEEHDKVMSLIQVLVHFNTIAIGETISRLGFDIKETLEYTSPIYRIELFMVGSILAQSARLYGNIPIHNPHTLNIINEHKKTVEKISKLILTKDLEGFVEMFQGASNYFDGYTKIALEEITYLTTKLGEYDIKNGKN